MFQGLCSPLAQKKFYSSTDDVGFSLKKGDTVLKFLEDTDFPYIGLMAFQIQNDPGNQVIEGAGLILEKPFPMIQKQGYNSYVLQNLDLLRATLQVFSHHEYHKNNVCTSREIKLKSLECYREYLPERVIGRKFHLGGKHPKKLLNMAVFSFSRRDRRIIYG